MESIIIFVKLLCAHLCSDFILQTDSINNGKRKPGIKGIGYLLLHSAIHACVAYMLVADWSCWLAPLVIFASHFIIDLIKCRCYKDSLSTFLADQFLHIISIGVLWFVLYGGGSVLSYIANHCSANVWLTVVAYILMLRPSSILLGLFLNKWTPVSSNTQSLPNAGQWIGYIERIMILTFVLVGTFSSFTIAILTGIVIRSLF